MLPYFLDFRPRTLIPMFFAISSRLTYRFLGCLAIFHDFCRPNGYFLSNSLAKVADLLNWNSYPHIEARIEEKLTNFLSKFGYGLRSPMHIDDATFNHRRNMGRLIFWLCRGTVALSPLFQSFIPLRCFFLYLPGYFLPARDEIICNSVTFPISWNNCFRLFVWNQFSEVGILAQELEISKN